MAYSLSPSRRLACGIAAALVSSVASIRQARAETFVAVTKLPATAKPRLLAPLNDGVIYSIERTGLPPEVHATDGVTDAMLASLGKAGEWIGERDALGIVGGRFVFRQAFGTGKLWATSGTAATTVDLGSDAPFPQSDGFYVLDADRAWFTRDNGSGRNVWTTDGTPAGTKKVLTLSDRGTYAPSFARAGKVTVFTHYSGASAGLWAYDGASATRIRPGRLLRGASTCGAYAYFLASPSGGSVDFTPGWWRTDGTAVGTVLVAEVDELTYASQACVGGRFVISELSKPLRASDGGVASDVGSASTKLAYGGLRAAGAHAFFVATVPADGGSVYVLHRTDGTAAGTVALLESPDDILMWSTTTNGKLLAATGGKIVVSDGTKAGTAKTAIEAEPVAGYSVAPWPDGRMYFWAKDAAHGAEPWVSDGSANGTRMLDDVRTGAEGSLNTSDIPQDSIFFADGRLFTLADDGTTGLQIFSTRVAPKGGVDAGVDDPGVDAGADGGKNGSSSGSEGAGEEEETGENGASPSADDASGGCGCRAAGEGRRAPFEAITGFAIALAAALRARRRSS